jgi:alpha-amylase
MRAICLYFQVHQPYRLRTYRFFDIGDNHYYYDDYTNRSVIRGVAENCFIPANNILLQHIKDFKDKFKVSFSLSGTAMEQTARFAPEALNGFKKLAKTGNVEFLAETYAHSLSSVFNRNEFIKQVNKHAEITEELLGQRPSTFRNTELLYSDTIGDMVADLGYNVMLVEGAKHILGWKSPNYLYCNNINPKLKLLLRNFQLSDDITFRFSNKDWSEWPLTADKFTDWLNAVDPKQEVVNIFIDYQTFGEHQKADTGILEFLKALPEAVLNNTDFEFHTPAEIATLLQPVSAINVKDAISWADEERDLTAWWGNELQKEALAKLYAYEEKVRNITDESLLKDWQYLQTSDHFYYMSTKWFSDGDVHKYFNPYASPYDAFINYMNVLADFMIRVDEMSEEVPVSKVEVSLPEPVVKAKKSPAKKASPKAKK